MKIEKGKVDMHRRFLSIMVMLLLVATLLNVNLTSVSANLFSVGWDSGYQVLNPSSTKDASIEITYYNEDGTLATITGGNPVSDTVLKNSSNNYYPIHALEGFRGSIVISSTEPVYAISNVVINTTAKATGSYIGITQGSNELNFPLVMKGNANQTSVLTIQNTGSTEADVTIKFTPLVGSSYSAISDVTDTIPSYASHSFDLSELTPFSSITRWVGSATATVTDTASDSIAGVSNTLNTQNSEAYQVATYNGFTTSGSTSVVLPLIQENNNGNRTGISCQNVGGTTTTITVTYTRAGTEYVNKATDSQAGVADGAMAAFVQNYEGTARFVGSALVTSNPASNLVCVVNQQKISNGSYSAYEGLDPASASGEVVLPLIVSKNGNTTNGYTYTGFSVATADGNSHPVTCEFIPSPGYANVTDQSQTGATTVFSQQDIYGNGNRFIGSAKCSVTDASGVGIFSVVNQTRELSPYPSRDILSTYNGFNTSP
jgi:hypothetical protein